MFMFLAKYLNYTWRFIVKLKFTSNGCNRNRSLDSGPPRSLSVPRRWLWWLGRKKNIAQPVKRTWLCLILVIWRQQLICSSLRMCVFKVSKRVVVYRFRRTHGVSTVGGNIMTSIIIVWRCSTNIESTSRLCTRRAFRYTVSDWLLRVTMVTGVPGPVYARTKRITRPYHRSP